MTRWELRWHTQKWPSYAVPSHDHAGLLQQKHSHVMSPQRTEHPLLLFHPFCRCRSYGPRKSHQNLDSFVMINTFPVRICYILLCSKARSSIEPYTWDLTSPVPVTNLSLVARAARLPISSPVPWVAGDK